MDVEGWSYFVELGDGMEVAGMWTMYDKSVSSNTSRFYTHYPALLWPRSVLWQSAPCMHTNTYLQDQQAEIVKSINAAWRWLLQLLTQKAKEVKELASGQAWFELERGWAGRADPAVLNSRRWNKWTWSLSTSFPPVIYFTLCWRDNM